MARRRRTAAPPRSWRLRRGDEVVVLAGRDKGLRGEIMKVLRDEGRVIVAGVNRVKRHRKPSAGSPGGIDEREAPIHMSNVALVDPSTSRPTRVGIRILADGRKARVARRSGELID